MNGYSRHFILGPDRMDRSGRMVSRWQKGEFVIVSGKFSASSMDAPLPEEWEVNRICSTLEQRGFNMAFVYREDKAMTTLQNVFFAWSKGWLCPGTMIVYCAAAQETPVRAALDFIARYDESVRDIVLLFDYDPVDYPSRLQKGLYWVCAHMPDIYWAMRLELLAAWGVRNLSRLGAVHRLISAAKSLKA